MYGAGANIPGMGKAMASACYQEVTATPHASDRFHTLLVSLARALGLDIKRKIDLHAYYWYWPGFTDVAILEYPSDMSLAVRIELRSGKRTVLCDPQEGFPSEKLIRALNLLRD